MCTRFTHVHTHTPLLGGAAVVLNVAVVYVVGLAAGGVEVEVGGGGGRGLPGDGSAAAVSSVSSWGNLDWMAGLLGGSLHRRKERER